MLNTEIYKALESIGGPISTAMVSMIPANDKYARPPYLRFSFKNADKEDPVYNEIRRSVKEFKGNLEWEVITYENTKNYIIIPVIFIKYLSLYNQYNKERYIVELTENEYNRLIDNALNDISQLSEKIRKITLARAVGSSSPDGSSEAYKSGQSS